MNQDNQTKQTVSEKLQTILADIPAGRFDWLEIQPRINEAFDFLADEIDRVEGLIAVKIERVSLLVDEMREPLDQR
jgi:hypothetical protein